MFREIRGEIVLYIFTTYKYLAWANPFHVASRVLSSTEGIKKKVLTIVDIFITLKVNIWVIFYLNFSRNFFNYETTMLATIDKFKL